MFVTDLQKKLSTLRRRLKTYFFIHGMSRLLIGIIICPFLFGILDLYFHLPLLIRASLLVSYFFYLLYLVLMTLWYPLRKPISDEDLALCVERRFPELQDFLISSIQLKKRIDRDPHYVDSRQMVELLFQETLQKVKGIRFHKSLTAKPVVKLALLCLIVLASLGGATLAYAYKRKPIFEVLISRLFLSSRQYPQKTHLALVLKQFQVIQGKGLPLEIQCNAEIQEGSLQIFKEENDELYHVSSTPLKNLERTPTGVAYHQDNVQESFYLRVDSLNINSTLYSFQVVPEGSTLNPTLSEFPIRIAPFVREIICANGENLDFKFRTVGEIPLTAEIVYQFSGGSRHREVLGETGPGAYEYTRFRSIQEPFTFYVQGGDDFDGEPVYEVEPRMSPKIDQMQITYHYPEYIEQKTVTQNGGKIVAPEGTLVHLEMKANLDLKSALITLSKANMSWEMNISGASASTQIQINQDDTYLLNLVGKKDLLPNARPIKYSIQAKKDNKPQVKNILPFGDMECSKDASIPLQFFANDDFKISSLLMRYKIQDEKSLQTVFFTDKEYFADEEKTKPGLLNQEKLYAAKIFEVKELIYTNPEDGKTRPIEEGDKVQFWAEATDNRLLKDKDGTVVAKPQTDASTRLQLTIVSKNDLERLLNDLLLTTKGELEEAKKLQEGQIQETETLLTIAKGNQPFEYSESQKQENLLLHQKKITRDARESLRNFERVLASIAINHLTMDEKRIQKMQTKLLEAIEDSKQTQEQMNQTRKQGEATRKSNFESSLKLEQAVLEKLKDLLKMMIEWEDFNEVVRTTQEILETQIKVRDLTKEKNPK